MEAKAGWEVAETVATHIAPSSHSPRSPCLARTQNTANRCHHHHTGHLRRTGERLCSRLSIYIQAAGVAERVVAMVVAAVEDYGALVMVEASKAAEGTAAAATVAVGTVAVAAVAVGTVAVAAVAADMVAVVMEAVAMVAVE